MLSPSHGFLVSDPFAPADPAQDVATLFLAVGGHDEFDVFAARFRRGISDQALRGRIPAGYGAVEGFRDDGLVGGFHRRAEQPFARRIMISRGFGAAMSLDLALQRGGFCIRLSPPPPTRPRPPPALPPAPAPLRTLPVPSTPSA